MDILLTLLFSILVLFSIGISYWFLNKQILKSEKNFTDAVDKLHKRIDLIFSVDLPSPNEAVEQKNDKVSLSEENILDIPADVKVSVEGGDNVPPGYDVAN